MANIHIPLVQKNRKGTYSVTDSKGNFLGTFKDKDYAMQRLWQVDDHKKGLKELKNR
jgi:hypothetical protein